MKFKRNINQLLSESRTDGEALLNYYRSCRNKIISENLVSSDYGFDCDSWGDSEVDSWSGDESVGDLNVEEERSVTQKYDGDATKETVSESVDEPLSGFVSTSDHVPVVVLDISSFEYLFL